jgi:hypothetical protein
MMEEINLRYYTVSTYVNFKMYPHVQLLYANKFFNEKQTNTQREMLFLSKDKV